jgi:hypothetical protein
MPAISYSKTNYLDTIRKHGYDCRHRKDHRTSAWAKREGLVEFVSVNLGGGLTGGKFVLTAKGQKLLEEQG